MEVGMTMSTAIESYAALHYSPFIMEPLLEAFYKHAVTQPKNILLAYLVLPLTLYNPSRQFLKNARHASSLRTFCDARSRLYGLPERVGEYRSLTHTSLQVGFDAGRLRIADDLSVVCTAKQVDVSASPMHAIKAAEKLATLFQPYDIPAIYRFLGVKRL
jgi:hypothetical protein